MPLSPITVTYLKTLHKFFKQAPGTITGTLKKIIDEAQNLDAVPSSCFEALEYIVENFDGELQIVIASHELYYSIKGPHQKLSLEKCLDLVNCYSAYICRGKISPIEMAEALLRQKYWLMEASKIAEKDKKNLNDLELYKMGRIFIGEAAMSRRVKTESVDNVAEAEKLFQLITNDFLKCAAYALLNFHKNKYTVALDKLDKLTKELNKKSEQSRRDILGAIDYNMDFLYGKCYHLLNRNEEAIQSFKLAAAKGHPSGLYRAGLVLEAQQKYEEAATCYKQDAPRIAEAAFNYYKLCVAGKVAGEDKVTAHAHLMAAKNWGHPEALFAYASMCEKENNYTQAVECYEAAKLLDHVPSMLRLGQIYARNKKLKNLALSRENYEAAASKGNPEAEFYVAQCYRYGRKGFPINANEADTKYHLAANSYKNILSTDPDHAHAHYMLAKIYAPDALNKPKWAMMHCKQAKKLKHTQAYILLNQLSRKKSETMSDELEVKDEAEQDQTPELPNQKEKTIYELMDEAHLAQSIGDFAKALDCWQQIKERDDSLLMQIQCGYAIANCYCEWAKASEAPENSLQIAQEQFEEALSHILSGMMHPDVTPSESSEFESWQQFIVEDAKRYQLNLSYDEFVPERIYLPEVPQAETQSDGRSYSSTEEKRNSKQKAFANAGDSRCNDDMRKSAGPCGGWSGIRFFTG